MSETRNRKTRLTAAALAIVGVAGLSIAAAAQLNLSFTGSFQAGAATVTADCQTGTVGVAFSAPQFETASTSGAPWKVGQINFTGISDKCFGKNYKVAYKINSTWAEVTGTTTVDGPSISVNVPSAVDQQTIKELALTIYS